jgi:hypothetical protein
MMRYNRTCEIQLKPNNLECTCQKKIKAKDHLTMYHLRVRKWRNNW